MIFLNFQKAYDMVPHKRLFKKLKTHGSDGRVADWIKDWLKRPKQKVVFEGRDQNLLTLQAGYYRDRFWGHCSLLNT